MQAALHCMKSAADDIEIDECGNQAQSGAEAVLFMPCSTIRFTDAWCERKAR
jgi:hypothetical protein